MAKNSIQVAIKIRPLFGKDRDQQYNWRIVDNSIQLMESQSEPYYFDHIFNKDARNQVLFDKLAKDVIHSGIQGFNGTIFAYGQTSSGKTYTMIGDEEDPGVMVLAAKEIFKEIERISDRQFLLRVGYIEIYNEKIFDLLNKKNQDLKIHDAATGIVSVNCEEKIITSEDELLDCLCKGNKARTVGETNMNERSSRSHAIFRIIIESRKMDRSEDDSVIQSVLNLVDLAGSERADQTGARGARLKEGGHINKSLLFLSNVIKRLSENEDHKFISYRDSKLTRILQASLGGNALTSIICTIKLTAVEETQSTLSFALRAKCIKNKPQVNEIVSEATMMKRLEREILYLKNLVNEERKNKSELKVNLIEDKLKQEVLKFITQESLKNMRNQKERRRRTWCSASTASEPMSKEPNYCPILQTNVSKLISKCQIPRPLQLRPPINAEFNKYKTVASNNVNSVIEEEVYQPGENFDFPNNPDQLKNISAQSPTLKLNFQQYRSLNLTPATAENPEERLKTVENAFEVLQEFTNLENTIGVENDIYRAIKEKCDALTVRNETLELERLKFLDQSLNNSEKRCAHLEEELYKLGSSKLSANVIILKYEEELTKLRESAEELKKANNEVNSLKYQLEEFQQKSKCRENELLGLINEKDKTIQDLQNRISTLEKLKVHNLNDTNINPAVRSNKICQWNYDEKPIKLENQTNTLEHNVDSVLLTPKICEKFKDYEQEIIKLQKEIKTLEQSLDEVNKSPVVKTPRICERCEDYEEEVTKLQKENKTFEKRIDRFMDANYDLRLSIADLEKKLKNDTKPIITQEQYNKLETMWMDEKKAICVLQISFKNIQQKYQQLQNDYDALGNQNVASQKDTNVLQNNNDILQKEINELRICLEKAQKDLLVKETNSNELQKNYDDLSIQIMDTLQENELIKKENKEFEKKLKDFELETEKNQFISKNKLQKSLQFINNEKELIDSSFGSMETLEDQTDGNDIRDKLNLHFIQLIRILNILDAKAVELIVFDKSLTTKDNCKYSLFIQKETNDKEKLSEVIRDKCGKIYLQIKFKEYLFYIITFNSNDNELDDETIGFLNEINEIDLLAEIRELKTMNNFLTENRASMVENTEGIIAVMREQINKLTAELTEKSMIDEKYACEDYVKQIENIEKDQSMIEMKCNKLRTELLRHDSSLMDINISNSFRQLNDRKIEMNKSMTMDSDIKNTNQKSNNQSLADELNGIMDSPITYLKSNQATSRHNNTSSGFSDRGHEMTDNKLITQLQLLKDEKNSLKQECFSIKDYLVNFEFENEKILNELRSLKKIVHVMKINEEELKEECNNLRLENCGKQELSENEFREHFREYNSQWTESKKNMENIIEILENKLNNSVSFETFNNLKHEYIENKKHFNNEISILKEDLADSYTTIKNLKEECFKLNEDHKILTEKLNGRINRLSFEKEELISENDKEKKLLICKIEEKAYLIEELNKSAFDIKNKIYNSNNELNKSVGNSTKNLTKITPTKTENEQNKKDISDIIFNLTNKSTFFDDFVEDYNCEVKVKLENDEYGYENETKKNVSLENKPQMDVETENAILKIEWSEALKECKELKLFCNNLQISMDVMTSQNKILNENIDKLKHQASETEFANSNKSIQHFNSIKEELYQCKHKLKNVEIDNETMIEQLEALENETSVLIKEKKEIIDEKKKLKDNENNLYSKIESLNAEMTNFKDKSHKHQELLNEKIMEKENEIQKGLQKSEQLTTELNSIKEKLRLSNESHEELKYKCELQDNEIKELKNELNVKLQELSEHDIQQEKLKSECNSIREEFYLNLSLLKKENIGLMSNLQELELKYNTLNVQHSEVMKTNELDAANELKKCNDHLKDLQKLQTHLDEQLKLNGIYKKQLEDTQKNEAIAQAELDRSIKLLNQLQEQYNELLTTMTENTDSKKKVEKDYSEVVEKMKIIYAINDKIQLKLEKSEERNSAIQSEFNCQMEKVEQLEQMKQTLTNSLNVNKAHSQRLEQIIECLNSEKKTVSDKLEATENLLRKMESELISQQIKNDNFQSSLDNSDNSLSPRMRNGDCSFSYKRDSGVRKNRRLNTHDERRRFACESYWPDCKDVETMTEPSDINCNCIELDEKLKICNRDLFIRESQVTALKINLKNHPLKAENAALIKRLQDEQEKNLLEFKKHEHIYSQKINKITEMYKAQQVLKEKNDKIEIKTTESQTEFELCGQLNTLQGKYNDLKLICRNRFKTIVDLENIINSNDNLRSEFMENKSLKKKCDELAEDVKVYSDKYKFAKDVLHMRKEENTLLRSKLESLNNIKDTQT